MNWTAVVHAKLSKEAGADRLQAEMTRGIFIPGATIQATHPACVASRRSPLTICGLRQLLRKRSHSPYMPRPKSANQALVLASLLESDGPLYLSPGPMSKSYRLRRKTFELLMSNKIREGPQCFAQIIRSYRKIGAFAKRAIAKYRPI